MAHSHAPAVQVQDASTSQLVWLLIGDVADIVDDGLDVEGLQWLVPVLETLHKQMTTQEQHDVRDGYLQEITDIQPNQFDHVETLHTLREQLRTELALLIDRIRETSARQDDDKPVDPFVARSLSAQLTRWVDCMTTHHRTERELCQSVWYMELGVGD